MEYKVGDTLIASGVLRTNTFAFSVESIKITEGVQLLYGSTLDGNKVYAVHPKLCTSLKVADLHSQAKTIERKPKTSKKEPIESDGKSSSYYDLNLSQKTIDFIRENGYVKTEMLIYDVFDNDFDFSNAFKSLVRAWGTVNGAGKKGNNLYYELNKIDYSVNKIREYRGNE